MKIHSNREDQQFNREVTNMGQNENSTCDKYVVRTYNAPCRVIQNSMSHIEINLEVLNI